MQFERNPAASTGAVSGAEITGYLRITSADLAEAQSFADTATAEIEAYTGLAILEQEIVATTDSIWPGCIIDLPVGPVALEATATVEVVEFDGTVTPVADGFWLESGRFPRLHFTGTEPAGRLRITYTAGYGADGFAVPADLTHAILAHTAKLFDTRGDCEGRGYAPGLALAAARIAARYRRVAL